MSAPMSKPSSAIAVPEKPVARSAATVRNFAVFFIGLFLCFFCYVIVQRASVWRLTAVVVKKQLAYGVNSFFFGPDPDAFGKVEDEDLAVTDFSGLCPLDDGIDRFVGVLFIDSYFQLELFQ